MLEFFQKYHAVRVQAGRGGGCDRIMYETATDAALIGHCEGECKAWDAELPAHVRLDVQNRLTEIRNELWKRSRRFGVGGVDYQGVGPPELVALTRAWYAACTRVGFGP